MIRDAGLPRLATEYGFGLARNHAFLDGNKRTAFVAMNVFLILNGYEIETAEAEAVDVMLRLAAGSLDLDAAREPSSSACQGVRSLRPGRGQLNMIRSMRHRPSRSRRQTLR